MLEKFAQEKRRRMTELWDKHFDQHNDGFEIFTSKLFPDAPALIIGFNPGGVLGKNKMTRERIKQFTSGDFSRPNQVTEGKHYHPDYLPEYASNSDVPGRIKKYLFEGKQDLPTQTVETNRYYMRTKNRSEHNKKLLRNLSSQAFREYMNFCRNTTHETINRTNPDVVIDFARRHDGRATEFCLDIGFNSKPLNYHSHKDNGSVKGCVSVAKMTEPPYSKVISIMPHLSAPTNQSVLNLFARVVPPHLPG
jgi:hypothetical protein